MTEPKDPREIARQVANSILDWLHDDSEYEYQVGDTDKATSFIASAIQAERDRVSMLRHAVFEAYQWCAARGANDKLLDNFMALLKGRELPYPEWPLENGLWKWEGCNHTAGTACEQCQEFLRTRNKALEDALKNCIAGCDNCGATGVVLYSNGIAGICTDCAQARAALAANKEG